MTKQAVVLKREEWARRDDAWSGRVEGKRFDTDASIIFFSTDIVGHGPKLHRHPYDEIFIVRQGNALFIVGDEQIEVTEGQVVFGPANIPHKFINLGPGRLETTDIHVTRHFEQEDLE
ncbi:cupin domain-containing protein [Brucella anthropi]|uniref:Cupin domain-containing protein n=2 Tax=Brucella TaxID=234 RepID=A0A6L3Z1E8_BRUAN|nr:MULTISPECIES: cupin domain-containing protein [Brucella/Ochrobactrum group]QTN05570.1 cupin domain-containing protein [Ochrobactrum sp. EEELCW01]RNL47726.1 cupin domain-containing protein [Ochrobactrum sp. MH181795]KAB2705099.1 cupin domain-containing protein [Brucella lupini]KAB2725072.1 cupin domain-containing protein [Brucella anthropi]KAB2742477.1 cupin domain-containing protein [Brucella anthropi]